MSAVESIAMNKCLETGKSNEAEILLCLVQAFEKDVASLERQGYQLSSDIVQWLLVIAGSMVMFMQAGFGMLSCGCVRRKNVVNTLIKNMMDCCMAGLAYYSVGFAFAHGDGGTFLGTSNFFGTGTIDFSFFFFQYTFQAAAVTIVAGTLAERCQMTSYFAYSFFLCAFVYPVVARAIWGSKGFLSAFAEDPHGGIGAVDFAGSGVVHFTGGVTALLATVVLGPRQGRFYDEEGAPIENPQPIKGHSTALQLLGTMLLWYGWYGFNCGSALLLGDTVDTAAVATHVAVNTTLAAACGALGAVFMEAFITGSKGEGYYSLPNAMNGALTGLVAITAPCGTVELWASTVIGLIAGWLYMFGSWLLVKFRIDDAVEAIPVHLFGGAFGLISTGLFSSSNGMMQVFGTDRYVGLFYASGNDADFTLFFNQLYALVFVFVWVSTCMLPFFLILHALGLFRVKSMDELLGLDAVYHAEEVPIDVKKEAKNAAMREDKPRSNLKGNNGPERFRGRVVTFS